MLQNDHLPAKFQKADANIILKLLVMLTDDQSRTANISALQFRLQQFKIFKYFRMILL
jgi:hypothetical protein